MPSTPIYGFPYAAQTDPPNGPSQGQSLATSVESHLATTDANTATNTTNIARSTSGPVSAKMRQSTAQTGIANNTWTKVNLQTADIDPSGVCNVSTSRITPGVLGHYTVSGRVSFAGGTPGSRFAGLYKNGVAVPFMTGGMTSAVEAGCGGTFCLPYQVTNITDYFELWCWHNQGGAINLFIDSLNASMLSFSFIRSS